MLVESLLIAGVALSAPILLAALGELVVERSGVLNIGIEGMMLSGAFAAAVAAASTGSATAGVVAAALAGLLVALLFAAAALGLRTDQILVGAGLNLLALGTTGALYRALFGSTGGALVLPTLPKLPIPFLADIPFVGPMLFVQHALVYVGLGLTPLLALLFSRTGLGLRIRSVGDHPLAAASLGYSVRAYRLAALLCGGLLAGLAGATLTLATASTFVEGITAGRGFIALALVVFGRWSAWGVAGGALLFGLASALQFQLQAAAFQVPYQLFLMLPYVLTLAVLLVSRGSALAPRALASQDRLP